MPMRSIRQDLSDLKIDSDAERLILPRPHDGVQTCGRDFALSQFTANAQLCSVTGVLRTDFILNELYYRAAERNAMYSTVFLEKPNAIAGAIATLV